VTTIFNNFPENELSDQIYCSFPYNWIFLGRLGCRGNNVVGLPVLENGVILVRDSLVYSVRSIGPVNPAMGSGRAPLSFVFTL